MTDLRYSLRRTTSGPFDGHEGIEPDATIGKLLTTMFHNWNEPGKPTFPQQVALCVADELQVLSLVPENDPCPAAQRIVMRLGWWLRIAQEIEDRMSEVESADEQHEADDWELYRVPTANGVPQFEHARQAEYDDFIAAGYAATANVTDAVRILMRPIAKDISTPEQTEVTP